MHKILKKTIKYGAAVLLTLIAVILTGIGYLYLSADMMTPQFASTPETDRVIRKTVSGSMAETTCGTVRADFGN